MDKQRDTDVVLHQKLIEEIVDARLEERNGGSLPVQTGEDSPVGTVTPTATGYVYIDRARGAIYEAAGPTDADWIAVGGVAGSQGIGEVIGVVSREGGIFMLGGTDSDTPLTGAGVTLSDAYSQWNGQGNGLRIVGNGTDGDQQLLWQNGAGAFNLIRDDGVVILGVVGVIFPTADPHIFGAWWDNDGTLTKSNGP